MAPKFLVPRSIPDILAESCRLNPEGAAIYALATRPSRYCDLLRRRDELVQQLNRLGVGRNDRVAVVLGNGPKLAASFLLISSAATFAPLNPDYTKSDFEFYLADLNARAVVVERDLESPAQ